MIQDFTKLLQAGMRPMAVFMVLFILGWLLTARIEVPMWYVTIVVSVLSYLFGERAGKKSVE
jgi:uncharacterized membrane protein